MAIKTKTIIFIFSAIVLNYSPLNIARADLGLIPIDPQGGNIQAGATTTNVSMDYEKVVLTYSNPQKTEKKSENGEVIDINKVINVHVSAIFKMMNNGTKAENIGVFFPADTTSFAEGGSPFIGDNKITNFKVNGKTLKKENLGDVSVSINGQDQKVPAYQWLETFYPEKEKQVVIDYDSAVSEESFYRVYYLAYILGTGRCWQGPIRKGEISFVLPERLTSYSVSRKPPQMKENKLPFQVQGNSINLSFSNYEPDSDEAILLSVYDFDTVNKIEQLKKEQPDFSNTLKIAGLFRGLSYGGHCFFCTEATTDEAKNYYSLALNKAVSKNELNLALGSFTYGLEGKENNYEIQMNNLFAIMSLKCPHGDYGCNKESIYFGRGYFDGTPFSVFFDGTNGKSYEDYSTYGKIKIPNSDFLKKYAAKMQFYDSSLSFLANNFLNGVPTNSDYNWKNIAANENNLVSPAVSASPAPTQGENKPVKQKIQQANILLPVGIAALFIILFALYALFKKSK